MATKEKSDAAFVLLPSPNAESYPQVTSQYLKCQRTAQEHQSISVVM